MKKNDICELEILENGINFEGIAKVGNFPIFVSDALKGEIVKARILKVNTSHAFAKVVECIKTSKERVQPVCEYYSKCGGCEAMHTTYENTLEIKLNNVKNTLRKQGIDVSLIEHIYGMGNPYCYRNKVQYPVRLFEGKNIMGMYKKRSHEVVENLTCQIHDEKIHEIARYTYEQICSENIKGYDEEKKTGELKNIMVRRGLHTGEVLVCLVVTNENLANDYRIKNVVEIVTKKYSEIKSFNLNINESDDNVILSDKNICLFGSEYIEDYIGEYRFKISTNSFFQVNTIQAEVLYNSLKEKMNMDKNKTLLELYSGVGSIGIFLSDAVKEIYGVEIVKEAVDMAEENVKLNNIENATYVLGDATIKIEELLNNGKKFDYLVVDPPRKGLDESGISVICKLLPEKIGYVSCNAATLARDIKMLSKYYEVENINLVDMFPWTSHVECVCVLNSKN